MIELVDRLSLLPHLLDASLQLVYLVLQLNIYYYCLPCRTLCYYLSLDRAVLLLLQRPQRYGQPLQQSIFALKFQDFDLKVVKTTAQRLCQRFNFIVLFRKLLPQLNTIFTRLLHYSLSPIKLYSIFHISLIETAYQLAQVPALLLRPKLALPSSRALLFAAQLWKFFFFRLFRNFNFHLYFLSRSRTNLVFGNEQLWKISLVIKIYFLLLYLDKQKILVSKISALHVRAPLGHCLNLLILYESAHLTLIAFPFVLAQILLDVDVDHVYFCSESKMVQKLEPDLLFLGDLKPLEVPYLSFEDCGQFEGTEELVGYGMKIDRTSIPFLIDGFQSWTYPILFHQPLYYFFLLFSRESTLESSDSLGMDLNGTQDSWRWTVLIEKSQFLRERSVDVQYLLSLYLSH